MMSTNVIKFVEQDKIQFLSCILYIRQPVEFFNVIYTYIITESWQGDVFLINFY